MQGLLHWLMLPGCGKITQIVQKVACSCRPSSPPLQFQNIEHRLVKRDFTVSPTATSSNVYVVDNYYEFFKSIVWILLRWVCKYLWLIIINNFFIILFIKLESIKKNKNYPIYKLQYSLKDYYRLRYKIIYIPLSNNNLSFWKKYFIT